MLILANVTWHFVFESDQCHPFLFSFLNYQQYWTKGNAFPLSYEQVCPLWGAIMEDMVKAATYDRDMVIAKR